MLKKIVVLWLLRSFDSSGIVSAGITEFPTTSGNVSPFICTDGTKIELSRVCNGSPDCPDSSDELRKLCHHIVCPESYYRCSYGACVARKSRCDGLDDCIDGSDEFACDLANICTDRQHRCLRSNDCVSLEKTCNGHPDCPDASDESEALCHDYPCPSDTFRCDYGGCIHRETMCDGAKDCMDGSDEDPKVCASINCRGNDCLAFVCRDDEFHCESGGQCIPAAKVCDGTHQCRDLSDERSQFCASKQCKEGFFRCQYGGCIVESLKCNLQANCYDWSDEDESICGVSLPEGACRLPPAKPETRYVVSNCDDCRPGQTVPELTRLNFTCNSPNPLEGASNVYCRQNHWLPKLPICITEESKDVTCPPVEAPGAKKSCKVQWGARQGWIDCNGEMPVGTRASFECPEYYERESGSSRVTCLHDGTWSQRPLRCRPICGVRETHPAAALVIKGWELKPDDAFPWHATLFSHENGEWTFFCGGTLISERAILTAGHCVWKTEENTVRVLLAAFSSNFTENNDDAQIFNVERVILQEAYQDHEGNYGSDVAIIILDGPALINSAVKPACLPSSSSIDVSRRIDEIGYAAGMGITENDTHSKNLRVTSLKVIAEEECRLSEKRDFRKYITYTTFCAGWLNGSAVCNGDSGGGFLLKSSTNSTIWEVHGVVSISPRRIDSNICDPNYYTIFTKVSAYMDWIVEVLRKFPVVGPPGELATGPNKDIIDIDQ